MMMLAEEPNWLSMQIALCKDGPKPWFQPNDYGASPESMPLEPELPNIPQDVLAQEVDLTEFPTFNQWKEAMWAAPFA
eukprot:599658-Amphidinium_carterae.1